MDKKLNQEITSRIIRKIGSLAARAHVNGYTQPVNLELTIPELRVLFALVKKT